MFYDVCFCYYCDNNKNWTKWFEVKCIIFILNVIYLFELSFKKIIYNFLWSKFFIYINK